MKAPHTTEIAHALEASQDALRAALADGDFVRRVAQAADIIIAALRVGKKVLIAGNGGSAADAQHLATELMVRYQRNRAPLPALALGTDASATTAIGNDLGFEHLFSRQVSALGRPGDVFIALSTSGRSINILAACRAARMHELKVIGFTGSRFRQMDDLCDVLIRVPNENVALIQQVYMAAGHALCEIIEHEFEDRGA